MNGNYTSIRFSLRRHIKYVVCISLLFTVFIWASYNLLQEEEKKEIVQLAQIEARANLNKGINYIRWMANQGGIYIKDQNVEGNGIGMNPDIQQKIFDPFFTTKDIGIGTGLGLSVSYTIIQNKHKGSISVDSAFGEGAKFTILLPLNFSDQHKEA